MSKDVKENKAKDAHTADTIDLAGTATNLTSADDTTLELIHDGTSWYEISRSVN